MSDTLIKITCMSCASRVTTTHRHGEQLHKCRRLGIIVSAANVLGVTITCEHYASRQAMAARVVSVPVPDYLL